MLRIGLDVGGTFTDIVAVDHDGVRATHKLLTSSADPIQAMLDGIKAVLEKIGAQASDIEGVVHGTTLVTNAVIERKGARTALITTAGFRDVAEIGREWRYDMYDIFLDPPPILVPRQYRFEVAERTTATGKVITPVRSDAVASLVSGLPKEITSVAICFLNSYAEPQNERVAAEAVKTARPDLYLSISADIAPEIREFERLSTTITNAYVQPIVKPYLTSFQRRLKNAGVNAPLLIVLSNGGLVTAETASQFPVRIIESGPAAGVIGAAYLGRQIAEERVLAFDMGGTTAKVTFVDDGRPLIAREFEAARAYRFRPGSGIPLKVPAVELLEVGAGGGSIASVDSMGRIRVGPESAGSSPGPVCYGLGGKKPTVTDADLVLGYLSSDYFLGGRMPLDTRGAIKSIEDVVGSPLGLDVVKAAWGIHQIINENMANALRVHSGERGKDTRKYSMIAFGGAGGLHACRVAQALRVPTIIFPELASVLSAFGMLSAPLAFDFVRTSRQGLNNVDWSLINNLFAEMEEEGYKLLLESGVERKEISVERICEMRFVGQGYEIEVPAPNGELNAHHGNSIGETFNGIYERFYGAVPAHLTPEVLNWRVRVAGKSPSLDPRPKAADSKVIAYETRPAYFPETGLQATPVYARAGLTVADSIVGPCIVQQEDTTIVVPPGWSGSKDRNSNLVLRFGG